MAKFSGLFSECGLTEIESKVYLTLLKTGSALAGEITERSGIHRRNVYDAIERLTQKGLVSSVVINNRRRFSPADSKRFLEIIEEKKRELDDKKKLLEEALPKLDAIKSDTAKHDVTFFRGAEGIKTVYDDVLRTGKDYIGYGHGEHVEKILKFYFKHYIERRKKLKIKPRLIYTEKERNKSYVKTALAEIRYLPNEYSSYAALRIYGDKVALFLFSEDEPLAILIKSKKIADGYRKYFEFIWDSARR